MSGKGAKIAAFGEIMLRISPSSSGERIAQAQEFVVQPGGSEANVAIALSVLGNRSAFISKLPPGALSEKILRHLRGYGVDTSRLVFGAGRLGLYWTETGKGHRPSEVIYDREGSSFSGIRYNEVDWGAVLKDAGWLHVSGITPAVSERACDTAVKALRAASKKAAISVDLNYRSKLWKWAGQKGHSVHKAMRRICADAYLISGNETDFSDCLGFGGGREMTLDGRREAAEQCFREFPRLRYVGVSLREAVSASENDWSGALFVKKNGRVAMHKGPQFRITDIEDRVGTGDSFTAGLIHGIIDYGNDPRHIIDFAVALSALNHSVRGDASQFKASDVEHLLKSPGGRIIR